MANRRNSKTGNWMKIAIFMMNSSSEYSGGRYHAWIMAEALAWHDHEVSVVTNAVPVFYKDFSTYPKHKHIKVCLTPDFKSDLPGEKIDVVVLIPHLEKKPDFFLRTVLFARKNRSRLIFLNFETPNWFNEYATEYRHPSLWRWWKEIGFVSDMIISSTKVSREYARTFFKTKKMVLHRYCYPAINSLVAANSQVKRKERQIICISRFMKGHRHKGGVDIIDAIGPEMKDFNLTVLVGAGEVDPELKKSILEKGDRFNLSVRFLTRLPDTRKFEEIKKSRLMLFLSRFEGFGYPPIESQFCDVACIVYDLPVLREVSGDGLIYVKAGDVSGLHIEIGNVISGRYRPPFRLHGGIENVAAIESFADRIDHLIREFIPMTNGPGVMKISLRTWIRWSFFWLADRFFKFIEKMKYHLLAGSSKIFK
jgi:glycosyltransferase involved in cell wall biosynthesis